MSSEENRRLFLHALEGGRYAKGPIEVDTRGRPVDPSAAGWCAVGLAYTLFHDSSRPGSLVPVRRALGVSRQQLFYLQNTLNDSALTFGEIAARIRHEWDWG